MQRLLCIYSSGGDLTWILRDELFARNLETQIIVPFADGMSHARQVRAKCRSGGFTHG